MSDEDFITVVIVIGIVVSFAKSNGNHKTKKEPKKSIQPSVKKPEPACDFCNDQPVYLGNAKVACPKCKGAAHSAKR